MPTPFENLYIFDGLSAEETNYFLMMSEVRHLKAGETLISEGELSDNRAYIVQSGSIEVVRGGQIVGILGAGQLCGEIALITSEPRTATVRAAEPTDLVVLNRDDFFLLIKNSGKQTEIRQEIMRRIRSNFADDTKS